MMENLGQISLREPLWLVLVLLPVLFLILNRSDYIFQARLKEFADPHLWRWLITQPEQKKLSIPWLLIIAWILAVIAMSGPYLKQQQPEVQQQRSIDIAVIIDISPSMKARDISPNRLERVKLEMQDFISNLRGDRTALIAFSSNAYKILPLTYDRDILLHYIKALDVTLTRKRGSNITQALELARQTLADSQQGSRAIILISDGESDDKDSTLAAAQRLKKDAILLYVLGVGSEVGGPVEDDLGRLLHYDNEVVISQLQRSTLITLAILGGGIYTDLTDDNSDWQKLFADMDSLERKNVTQTSISQLDYQLYPWLLGLSIILFVWSGTRRIEMIAMLLLTPMTFSHNAQAASWQEHKAYEALINGDYGKAHIAYEKIQTFNGQMGMGVAAYRQGDWQQALDAFSRAAQLAVSDNERAKAAYNSGNALAHMGDYGKASTAYEKALALQKNYPHAALNLSMVNKARTQFSVKKNDQSNITPDAEDVLSDRNAERDDASIANTKQEKISPSGSADKTIAQWDLGSLATDHALGSALWQLRSLDESSDVLLRARFTQQDAQHPDIVEEKPW